MFPYFMRQMFVLFSLVLFKAYSSPITRENIKKAFETQDKICSLTFSSGDGSYTRMFEKVTGLNLPSPFRTQDTLYTGFKFLRTYSFQPFSLSLNCFLKVAFCDAGKVQWETSLPVKQELDWESPLCAYIPDSSNKIQKKKVLKFWNKNAKNAGSHNRMGHGLRTQAQDDLANFHCFKLARRKKYLRRKTSLFFPGSWVGGMFFCELTDDMKKDVLSRMNQDMSLMDLGELKICTRRNTIPLTPLESDNYGRNWVEFENPKIFSLLGIIRDYRITRFVPYLFSPNVNSAETNLKKINSMGSSQLIQSGPRPLHDRMVDVFYGTDSACNANDPWFTEIEVQERYKITEEEKSIIDKLTNRTINRLNIVAISSNSSARNLFTNSDLFIDSDLNTSKSGFEKRLKKTLRDMESDAWRMLPTGDKSMAVMGTNPSELEDLESKWKNLQLNVQKHKYLTFN